MMLSATRTNVDIIREALDRAIGGVGWVVTPQVTWNVPDSYWKATVKNAHALANEIGRDYGLKFSIYDIETAMIARGYYPNEYDPQPTTAVAPPLEPDVTPVSPPIKHITAPISEWPTTIPPITYAPNLPELKEQWREWKEEHEEAEDFSRELQLIVFGTLIPFILETLTGG